MDHLHKYISQVRLRLLLILLLDNVIFLADWYLTDKVFHLAGYFAFGALLVVPLLAVTILPWLSSRYLTQPTKLLWQAISHIAPSEDGHQTPAPDTTSLKVGQELVASLVSHVYQLANVAEKTQLAPTPAADLHVNFIANNLPLPLIVLDPAQTITFANDACCKYVGLVQADIIGKNVYSILDMSFPSPDTFDKWLESAKANTVTSAKSWSHVRLNPTDSRPERLFDLAAYYNKNNPEKIENMLVLFDHTKEYSQDDQAVSFVALSVHELRTPLTLLRGYIEAFEEELGGSLNPQMKDFMFKMSASAQQLSAFVNNILNVARVADDQLVLQLHEENWGNIVRSAANGMALRAKVRGITIEYSIAPDLPTVGVDRVSIHEVINNLVDNAIKYSGNGTKIRISTYMGTDGMVETTVQDFGVGIDVSVIPNLFTKFYRDHRNRAQIGGTGLGLYLSKAIVTAHGGNIWVHSKVGEGSIFGFTLMPYAKLADEIKNSDNKEIVRGAHGWIKNHSLYRR
jgi:signal transduction histidine kinase